MEQPRLYHSADRGVSWSKQFYRFGFGLLDIAFQSDGRTGFASGSEGAILRTLDAGQSWEPATLGRLRLASPAPITNGGSSLGEFLRRSRCWECSGAIFADSSSGARGGASSH